MSRFSRPCAKKIVDLNTDKIVSDNEALQKILLQPEIENKPVCVISITGTFRQGKSFLLNFLLRYLNLKYKVKKPLGSCWLSADDGNISGFEWRCGKERHTMGILMWSEIFLAELPTGREVAIVLLDTQGTFDNKTTKQQCAAIFAISTLISSVQIFNLKTQISQSDLEYLECFSGYGQMAVDGNSKERPFQNLCFLIRDWQYAYQNSYGASGGQSYLNEFLNSSEQPDELRHQNDNIKALFKRMSCFLLPHPGDKVATQPNFTGEMEDINDEFLQHVEQFVLTVLAPENLVSKIVNGAEIKAKDLVEFIQSYCQFFMSEDTPPLESMYMATSSAQLNIALKEAQKLYEDSMNLLINETSEAFEENYLETEHQIREGEAVRHLQEKKIMGDDDLKESYIAELKKALQDKFTEYKKINNIKLEKEQQLEEIKHELKKTEERFIEQLENQKEGYEKILEKQQSVIDESAKKQEKLQCKVTDLEEHIEEIENNTEKEKERLENQIAQLQATRNDIDDLESDGLNQLIHGVSQAAHGVVNAAVGAAKVAIVQPIKKLKFW